MFASVIFAKRITRAARYSRFWASFSTPPGFARDDAPADKRAKLEKLLALPGRRAAQDIAPLGAELLGVAGRTGRQIQPTAIRSANAAASSPH